MATALQIDPARAAQEVADYLATNLGATLTSVAAEYADGITLGSVDYYWTFPQAKYPGELNIVVYPVQTEPLNSGDQRHKHQLNLMVIVGGQQDHATISTVEVLNKRAWRVQYAVHAVLNNTTLDNTVDRVFVDEATLTSDLLDTPGLEQRIETTIDVYTTVT